MVTKTQKIHIEYIQTKKVAFLFVCAIQSVDDNYLICLLIHVPIYRNGLVVKLHILFDRPRQKFATKHFLSTQVINFKKNINVFCLLSGNSKKLLIRLFCSVNFVKTYYFQRFTGGYPKICEFSLFSRFTDPQVLNLRTHLYQIFKEFSLSVTIVFPEHP